MYIFYIENDKQKSILPISGPYFEYIWLVYRFYGVKIIFKKKSSRHWTI